MVKYLRFFFRRIALLWVFFALLSGGRALAQVANDDCAVAVSIAVTADCVVPLNGTVQSATQSLAPTTACGFNVTTALDVWYSFVATSTSHQVTLAPRFAAILDIRSGTCAASTSVFCTAITNGNTTATQVGGLTSGQTYFLRIYPSAGMPPAGISSTFALCVGPGATLPANDDCTGAINVPVTTGACTGTVSADNTSATSSPGAPAPTCASYQGRDLWFSVVVPAGGALTVQTVTPAAGTGVSDTGMSIYSGTCGSLTTLGCDDDGGGATKSLLSFSGRTPGEVLYVRVWSFGNNQGGLIAVCATALTPTTNDDCAGAVPIPVTAACTAPVSGNLLGASQSLPPTAACGTSTAANDVWYSFVASGATQTVILTGNFNAVIDIRSGTCASSASVFCGTVFIGQGLTVNGLTSGQSYFLRLYVNGNFTPVNTAFTLCINPGPTPPTNDECSGAVAMAVATSCATPVAGTVAGASQSLPVTATCGFATNANDVWYSFVANGTSQTVAFTGNFGAVLDVRSGTCASSTSVFCGTIFNGQSMIATGLTSGQSYFLRVYANSIVQPLPANSAFTLCVTAGLPALVNDECSTAVAVAVVIGCATSTNGTVAAATQSLPPTASCGGVFTAVDVWYSFVASAPTQLITLTTRFLAVMDVRSGACANSTSLFCTSIFANATTGTVVGGLTTGQTYFIRIYANGGTQPLPANATFTLCISPAPTPPANDNCAGAIAVAVTATCAAPVSGTVEAASQSLAPATGCGTANIAAQDVWYSFVANGPAQLITLNSRFAAVLDVRSGTCTNSTSVACATVFANATGGTSMGGLISGQTYFLRIYANSVIQPTPANATFTLCILTAPTPPVNDDCVGAIAVPVQFGATCVSQTTADNSAATGSAGVPAPGCANYQGQDVWFQVTVPATGTVTVRTVVPTIGTDVGDTGLAIYSGTCTALTLRGCDDDSGGGLKSLLTLTGRTPGEILYVRAWGFNGTAMGVLAVCATTPTNCATPTVLTSASITNGAAQVSWQPGGTPATGTTYTVEYGLQGFIFGTGTVISALTAPTVQLTGLSSGTAYCFYVRQNCPSPNGSSAYAGPACFTTLCGLPVGLNTTAITAASVQLGWQASGTPPSGTTYTVEYGPQGFTQGTGTIISGITTTGFQLSNLQAATNYCFYVRQDCPGSTGGAAFAGPSCFITAPASVTCLSPGSLAASSPMSTGAQLSWLPGGTPATGVTYTVQYGLQGFVPGSGVTVSGVIGSSFSLTGLTPATSYCFYVQQNCPGTNGSSAYAGPVCFQTATAAGGPANDEPCGAVTLGISRTGTPAPILSSTNVGATTSAQPGIQLPACAPTTTPRDVWFTMVPAAGITSVTLRLTDTAAGMVRVFTAPGCSAGPFTLVACQGSGINNTGVSTMVVAAVPGQTYYIAVSGYGGSDLSGTFTLAAGATVTATRTQFDTNALLVYPNPSSTGQLTLKLSTASLGAAQASLVNALGQTVRSETLRSGSNEQVINTHGLATGVYTIRVIIGNDVLIRKVVLE